MILTVEKNKDRLLQYWWDERQMPRWFTESNGMGLHTDEDFLDFCSKMKVIYEVGDCAVYVEESGNMHLSKLRGAKIDVETVYALRDELLDIPCLFAWVCGRNWGLKRLLKAWGFTFDGLVMRYGSSHGKVLKWECYKLVAT